MKIEPFGEGQRFAASKARLNLEIELRRRDQKDEVVLLEAASEEALYKTHARYFENVDSLLALASNS